MCEWLCDLVRMHIQVRWQRFTVSDLQSIVYCALRSIKQNKKILLTRKKEREREKGSEFSIETYLANRENCISRYRPKKYCVTLIMKHRKRNIVIVSNNFINELPLFCKIVVKLWERERYLNIFLVAAGSIHTYNFEPKRRVFIHSVQNEE